MYVNFAPCTPSFAIMTRAAAANGTAPTASRSPRVTSNCTTMTAMGTMLAGTAAKRQFIARFSQVQI